LTIFVSFIYIFWSNPPDRYRIAWLEKNPIIQTEGEQVGREWEQLLIQRGFKKFEARTGEKF
jgi:hypothetical protein